MNGKLGKLNKDSLPVFEIIMEDFQDMTDDTGIQLISVVDEPAIGVKGVKLSDSSEMMLFKKMESEDKMILVGPALIPDVNIYRENKKWGKHFIKFSAETIENLVKKMNRVGSNRKINIDHSDRMVDAFIMEDWIIENEMYDKSKIWGFDLPKGTYMLKVQIEDRDFWENEVKGNDKFSFSIEGYLNQSLVSLSKERTIEDMIDELSDLDILELLQLKDFIKSNLK
jgi:hypothetical protein